MNNITQRRRKWKRTDDNNVSINPPKKQRLTDVNKNNKNNIIMMNSLHICKYAWLQY